MKRAGKRSLSGNPEQEGTMARPMLFLSMVCVLGACSTEKGVATDTGRSMDTGATAAPVAMNDDAARPQIEALRNAWVDAAGRDDAAAVANLYAEHAIFVGTETAVANGRAAIQAALAQSFPVTSLTKVESRDLVVNGALAYDYGEFTQQVTPPNAPATTVNGHYLVVLRRQDDGSWKIVRHVSTTPPIAR